MRPQRVREAESRMELQAAKWTAEGAVNSHYFESAQYSATWGIRQLPGICRYSAKRTVQTVQQGPPPHTQSYKKNKQKNKFLSRAHVFSRCVSIIDPVNQF